MVEKAQAFVETEKMRLAAEALRHYLKLNEETVTLDNIVTNVRAAIDGELTGNSTDDLDALLVSQAKILDATFTFYADQARTCRYDPDSKVNMALKAQRQAERTIKTLRRLRQEGQKAKLKKFAERTISSDAET